ncbi:MAG: pyruvate kinase [Spirochaetaceae bacterium]|nr:MAG: pyruvate kinase [Spirochaetaceae bacterium]
MPFRKTKIVCTLGPAVADKHTLKQLLKTGMNVARFNCAHGDHEYHASLMKMLREASRETGLPCAILLYVKGPEIRTGRIKDSGTITLKTGDRIIITTRDIEGTEQELSISYKELPADLSPGKHILVADGVVDLVVEKIEGTELHCFIRSGGIIGSRKNVNVIGVKTKLPGVTKKDVADIMFGIQQGIDFIAASFVRTPQNIMEIRGIVDVCDVKIDIIAKIEDEEGLHNIDEIIRVADGIMVARGDLGVQLPAQEIPLIQKRIIRKCNAGNKPVITATQMLDSMISNPIPTRAEVTDIANAIFDGTDAVMLSGETASGKYPVESVDIMNKIALETERSPEFRKQQELRYHDTTRLNMSDTISRAAALTAHDIRADAIITPTLHGYSPRLISRFRPDQFIFAITPNQDVLRKLLLIWGVYPVIGENLDDAPSMIAQAIEAGTKRGLLEPFDRVVFLAGIPVNSPIMLNTIRVHVIANVLCKGMRGYGKRAEGIIVKAANAEEALSRITGSGREILCVKYIDDKMKPVLNKIPGYIVQEFSSISWQEIERENPSLVGIAGATSAMETLVDGQEVTLDGTEKLVFEGTAGKKQGRRIQNEH